MATKGPTAVFSIAAAILAAGCGGSNPGATCGAVAPCGGNLAGQWEVVDSCISRSVAMELVTAEFQDSCPTATAEGVDLQATGMMSFKADMTYAVAFSLSGSITIGLPTDCFSGLTCEHVSALLQLQLQKDPEPSIQSFTCSGGTVCSCRIGLSNQATQENGTYSTTGSTLATQPTAGAADLQQYCAQGGSLHVVELSTTMSLGPMGNATVASDIVAVRAK